MSDNGHTVGELSAYLARLRHAPSHSAKSLSNIRSAARVVLRELGLPAELFWTFDTVEDWCQAYARSSHATRQPPATVAVYQTRLRAAARLFDAAHTTPVAAANSQPAWLCDIKPTPRLLHDLRLLAAAWRTSQADTVARLIRFYQNFNPADTPPAPPDTGDIEVFGRYKRTTVTGIYHSRSRAITITSPPCQGEWFSTSSAAAKAVITALNPSISAANRTGYDFWTITATGGKLRTIIGR